MVWVFGILITALVLKDIVYLGDTYVLRGLSQGTALAVGVAWLATRGRVDLAGRYWPVFAYLAVLPMTIFVTRRPLFVGLQVLSLYAVVLFFLAFVESRREAGKSTIVPLGVIAAVYTAVCLASVILSVTAPALAYESTLEGLRFKGLFGKSAMMGATAGLLFGLSLFGQWSRTLRVAGLLGSLPCLYMTGSRTFWIAAVVSAALTAVLYLKRKLTWLMVLGTLALVLALAYMTGSVRMHIEKPSQIVRQQSLENLSGRTKIWSMAADKFRERPLLGYGFTAGGDAFEGHTIETRALSTPAGPTWLFSLHNGYFQALLDSGALGMSFYLAVMVAAFWKLFIRDKRRNYGPEWYALAFLAIGNVGESIVFGAAVDYEVFYWYVAIFALGLRHEGTAIEETPPLAAGATGLAVMTMRRYPIISG
jgi:O-antigen ligase